MTSEATAAKDAASATTTFSLKPQHADSPDVILVFRCVRGAESTHAGRAVGRKGRCLPSLKLLEY